MTESAWIGIRVPDVAVPALKAIEVPGDPITDEYHITLVYIGDIEEKPLAQCMLALLDFCEEQSPFSVQTHTVTSFPRNPDDGVPIICEMNCETDFLDLVLFQERLRDALDKANVPYSKKYPDYRPHVTLRYSQEDVALEPFEIDPIEFEVGYIFLALGGSGNDKADMEFRLGPLRDPVVAKLVRIARTLLIEQKEADPLYRHRNRT